MINAGILVVIGLPILLALAGASARRSEPWGTVLVRVALAIWVLAVIAATLFPFPYQRELIEAERQDQLLANNAVPLATIAPALLGGFGRPMFQVFANAAMFVPLGFLLPLLGATRLSQVLTIAIAASFGIELTQLVLSAILGFTYKIADIDDVLLNVAGAVVGYGVYRFVWLRLVSSEESTDLTASGDSTAI